MPRTWSPEQRAQASERGKQRGFRGADVAPVSPAQRLIAQQHDMEADRSEYADEDIGDSMLAERPSITHTRPGKVRVYKLTPSGSVPILVSVQSLVGREGVLNSPNYSAVCFDCGSDQCGEGQNACPGRPPRKFRVCPIQTCGKRVYDPKPTGRYLQTDGMSREAADDEDESAIKDEAYDQSTPEIRTKVLLDRHIVGYHEQEAIALGLRAPTLRDMTTPIAVGR